MRVRMRVRMRVKMRVRLNVRDRGRVRLRGPSPKFLFEATGLTPVINT